MSEIEIINPRAVQTLPEVSRNHPIATSIAPPELQVAILTQANRDIQVFPEATQYYFVQPEAVPVTQGGPAQLIEFPVFDQKPTEIQSKMGYLHGPHNKDSAKALMYVIQEGLYFARMDIWDDQIKEYFKQKGITSSQHFSMGMLNSIAQIRSYTEQSSETENERSQRGQLNHVLGMEQRALQIQSVYSLEYLATLIEELESYITQKTTKYNNELLSIISKNPQQWDETTKEYHQRIEKKGKKTTAYYDMKAAVDQLAGVFYAKKVLQELLSHGADLDLQ